MKCPKCNYEAQNNFDKCPACGTLINQSPNVGYPYQNQPYQPYNYAANSNPYNSPQVSRKTAGEKVAIGVAIAVSVLTVLVTFFIILDFVAYISEPLNPSDPYYWDEDTYSDFLDQYDNYDYHYDYDYDEGYTIDNPAEKNTPIEFHEQLYSFSNGYVDTTYEVELEETYCGDAAVKMLDGAKLPQITDSEEILLVKFNVTITEQDTEAYVSIYPIYSTAYSDSGSVYSALYSIKYRNDTELLMKGESGTRWLAFVVDKGENPYIMWDSFEGQYFLNTYDSISDPSEVTEGEAIEPEIENAPAEDTSSAE